MWWRRQRFELWHPESPGLTVIVWRSWWQRLLYPRAFATLGEVLRARDEGGRFDSDFLYFGPDGDCTRTIESTEPPRLLGDGCGCKRTRQVDNKLWPWRLDVCEKHRDEPLKAFLP